MARADGTRSRSGKHTKTDKQRGIGHDYRKLRPLVFARYGTNCHWCGVQTTPMQANRPQPTSRTVDHLVPRSRGGMTPTVDDLRPCCWKCNCSRGNRRSPASRSPASRSQRRPHADARRTTWRTVGSLVPPLTPPQATTCHHCGKSYERVWNEAQRFCSRPCSNASRVTKTPTSPSTRQCLECDGPFTTTRTQQITCSRECSRRRNNRKGAPRPMRETRACPECPTTFQTTTTSLQTYCSQQHQKRAEGRRREQRTRAAAKQSHLPA